MKTHKLKTILHQVSSERSIFSSIHKPISKLNHPMKSEEEKGVNSMRRLFKESTNNQRFISFKYQGEGESDNIEEEILRKTLELILNYKFLVVFTCINWILAGIEVFLSFTFPELITVKKCRYCFIKLALLSVIGLLEGIFWKKTSRNSEFFILKGEFLLIFACFILNFLFIGEFFWTEPSKLDHFCSGFLLFFFSKVLSFSPKISSLLQIISIILMIIKTAAEFQYESLIIILLTFLAIVMNFLYSYEKKLEDKRQKIRHIQCNENKKFYKSFLNLFPDGLAFIGKDLEFEYSNRSFMNLLASLEHLDVKDKLKSLKNINYEPAKSKNLRKSHSLPIIKPTNAQVHSIKTKKGLISDSLIKEKPINFKLKNYDSKLKSSLKRLNTLKGYKTQRFISYLTLQKSKKNLRKSTSKKPFPATVLLRNLSKKQTIKGTQTLIRQNKQRLLHTEYDESAMESMIFGKVKQVEFHMKSSHYPFIFISNYQTLHEAITEILEKMQIYQENNLDLLSFNTEFNSILIFKTLIENPDKSQKTLEIRIIPIFFKNEPKLILSLNDCTDLMTIELMKKTDEYKNILMSYVSHELRTPLNGMLAMIESMRERIPPDLIEEFIDPSLNCGKNLLCLINDILDFEQIRKGKMRLFEKEFVLKTSLEETINIIKLEASKKHLKLHIKIGPFVPEIIMSDQNRFRQIVLNLLGNSLKFTSSGSITIHVSHYKENIVQISVKDTGLGIKPEDQHKLFKQFGKLDLQDKNFLNAQGVGLGLIISHSLATELGPKSQGCSNLRGLKVKSELGKGSEFYFLLENRRKMNPEDIDDESIHISNNFPAFKKGSEIRNRFFFSLKRKNSKPIISTIKGSFNSISNSIPFNYSIFSKETMEFSKSPIKSSKFSEKLCAKDHQKLKKNKKNCFCNDILIVDDHFYNIMALEHFFKRINKTFESCSNGLEAVEKVQIRLKNDCCPLYPFIFMDCEMPIMNGFQAVKEIKKLLKEKKNTIIIAATAHCGENEKKKCFEVGMDDVLMKPVGFQELVDMIRKWEEKKEENTIKKSHLKSNSL